MEKNCINCKWYARGGCINKEVNKNLSISSEVDGTTYVEDGHLNENIHDSLNVGDVVKLVLDKLYEQDFIKKSKNIKKFDYDDIEDELAELIDGSLSRGIMNYFNKDNDNNIEIDEPRDFGCSYWE